MFEGLPNFVTKQFYSFVQKLIDHGFAVVYIDDILLLSLTNPLMIEVNEQLQQIRKLINLKLAPEKSFYMLLTVKILEHDIRN